AGGDDLERRLAALRLDHLVALVAERARAEQPHGILVLDQEQRAGAGQVARRRGVAEIGRLGRGEGFAARMARQEDRERGALLGLAVDEDESAGLLDDAIDGGEAEAGAGADFLGREERLEDARQILARDADAG